MQRKILFKHLDSITYLKKHKGIYIIRNSETKDFYLGSTDRNFKERFLEHCSVYYKYLKDGGRIIHPLLWAAFQKYGIENFEIEIFELMDNATEKEILAKEGYYIRTLRPKYNVALEPEKGGSPNKGKKLTDSWKKHIAEKSAQYKHSPETLALVTENNKKNACKFNIEKDGEIKIFNSVQELAAFFNLIPPGGTRFQSAINEKCLYRGWKIKRLQSQKKRIKVYFNEKEEIFNSFNACDRALCMWRGYTSTMYNRGIKLLKDQFLYEVL